MDSRSRCPKRAMRASIALFSRFWESRGKKTRLRHVSLADQAPWATSTRRIPVEDQDKRTEEQEDVEAHRRKAQFQASEDAPAAEGEGDDVEAHRHKKSMQASEGAPEAEGE